MVQTPDHLYVPHTLSLQRVRAATSLKLYFFSRVALHFCIS
jgi:hypothetical protein